MKNILFISLACILGFSACGQTVKKDDVPDAITAKFKTLYPNADNVKWGKEKENYEAEFDLDKVETSVVFDAAGNALETESEIAISGLPAAVKDYIKTNYNDASIKEASKIQDAKGVITFEAELKVADVIFDAQGKFIKEVKKQGEKDIVLPLAVKVKFASLYPGVKNVKWGNENEDFEAKFKWNNVETFAHFDSKGNLSDTEVEISVKDLPEAVFSYVTGKLNGAKITEASKITTAKGVVTYEAVVNGMAYIFDQNGKFITKTKEETD